MKKQRNQYIEFMRIIAAIGVFTGHFLGIGIASEKSRILLRFLRDSYMGKTILAYFYEGDISVIFFFCLGGFFITYTFNSKDAFFDKCFSRVFLLMSSAVIVTAFHTIINILLNGGRNISAHMTLCRSDINKLFGGGTDLGLSYQLWFVYYLSVAYMLIYAIIGITRNRRLLRILMLIIMAVCYYKRQVYYGEVIIGALAGEITALIEQREIRKKRFTWLIVLAALIIGP